MTIVDLSGLINDPTYLLSFIVYFVLGYLFYAALLCFYLGVGSPLVDSFSALPAMPG